MPEPSNSAPLRVLSVGTVYPPHLLGGYEVIWRGVMRRLRADGHLARVLVTDYRRPEAEPDAAEDPDVHRELDWYWRDHEWPRFSPRRRLALERRNAAALDRHLREFDPEVITWWALGGLSLGLIERARRAGIPQLFFVLDPWPSYGPVHDQWTRMWSRSRPAAALAERLTGLPARPRLGAAGRWLFCSASMQETTVRTGLSFPDQAIVAPGVEQSFLDVPREPAATAWRWRLLYIGRVVQQKGVLTAVRSLAHLPPEATLRIVGEGDPPYRRQLERLAVELGVSERVSFESPLPRSALIEVYRAADAVIFPVEWAEPFGLVPLEAMALGRPVVATGQGGSGDFLTDGENALLFTPADARGLAGAVRRLAGDEGLRDRLRERGYETAAQYSEEAFNRRAVDEIVAAARTRVR
jgi:glycosyltransferase involved in cell wall biosynthesis